MTRDSAPDFCILNGDAAHTVAIKLRKCVILFTCSRDDALLDSNSLHLTGGAYINLSVSAILVASTTRTSK